MDDWDIDVSHGWSAFTFIKISYLYLLKFTLLTSMDSQGKYSLRTGYQHYTILCGQV